MVHSAAYYKLGFSLVSDAQFDGWAYELVRLQKERPDLADQVDYEREAFQDFDGSTGYDLPYNNPRAITCALNLFYQRKKGVPSEHS
ncbi:hypothetical protein GS454_04615 [Rhodococcus hoagii]|nr:hypothetical protein [Prescottella equi]